MKKQTTQSTAKQNYTYNTWSVNEVAYSTMLPSAHGARAMIQLEHSDDWNYLAVQTYDNNTPRPDCNII